MRIRRLSIQHFRGIESADLRLADHTLLVGENNVGKTTILEALNLALGPDRIGRPDSIDEHDFFLRQYERAAEEDPTPEREATSDAAASSPEIRIDVILDDLNPNDLSRFHAHLELWNDTEDRPYSAEEIEDEEPAAEEHYVLRVTFRGWYDQDEDEFRCESTFTKSEITGTEHTVLTRRDKQRIGFLYLRGYRTATRAASLERGSLLDILLDIKKARPRVWGAILRQLDALGDALEDDESFKRVLNDLEGKIDRYLPNRSGGARRSALFVSDLTRRELRGVMTYFLDSPGHNRLVPLARLGSGTTNILVLALLTAIAETKENVIFGMEEPEIALPPYTQRRILRQLSLLAAQTIVTSHSPYIAERFLDEDILVLRNEGGALTGTAIRNAGGIEAKRLRQDFRIRYAEGILSNAVLVCEGISDRAVLAEINHKLASLENTAYVDLDILGVTVVPADSTAKEIVKVATFYKALNVPVFAVSDALQAAEASDIRAVTEWHENLPWRGLEQLLGETCKAADIRHFLQAVRSEPTWPGIALPTDADADNEWRQCFRRVLSTRKGDEYAARFVSDLTPEQLPSSLVAVLVRVAEHVQGCRYERSDPIWGLIGDAPPEFFVETVSTEDA